jgi:hypothetical protein
MTITTFSKRPRFLGLVHHPIINKRGELITTSVTNLDIHDIARSCRTFGVEKYFIITPIELQQQLVKKILGHWESAVANDYNPDRFDALSHVSVVSSFEEARQEIASLYQAPQVVVTGANFSEFSGSCEEFKLSHNNSHIPIFLLFGTGWGLHPEILKKADYHLEPLFGSALDGYNHLSVRSAVAIYCDRLWSSRL